MHHLANSINQQEPHRSSLMESHRSLLMETRAELKESEVTNIRLIVAVPARRRIDPILLGLLLGGSCLGAFGSVIALAYSYRHPVGLVVSVIWWGICFGALGASLGALPGLLTQRRRLLYSKRLAARPLQGRGSSSELRSSCSP
jgi:hypothetical protein